jgi:flagellar protein FliS
MTTMFGTTAYLESRILSADPIELVAILYEHAILYTGQARERLAKRDIPGRSEKIARVIGIIGELDSSLNHAAGGEISANLARLYQYIRQRLVTANLQQLDEPLAEVEQLLGTLAEAWTGVARGHDVPPAATSASPAMKFEMPSFMADAPVYQSNPYTGSGSQSSNAWTA